MTSYLFAIGMIMLFTTSSTEAFQSQEGEERLHKFLDTVVNDTRVKPRTGDSSGIDVSVGVQFMKIVELDVLKGKLAMTANMFGSWIDSRFEWNVTDFGGNVCVQRSRDKHWYPTFELYSASEKSIFTPEDSIFICSPPPEIAKRWDTKPGIHFFDLFQKFEILCDFDVYKFPFDTQVCTYFFSSYLFDNTTIRLVDFAVDPQSTYMENKEWQLDGITKTFRHQTLLIASRQQNRSVMEFKIHLRRRSLSYIGTIFVPAAALAILTLTIYIIPAESGEKIGLGISVFLAFSVFQLIFVNSLPQSDVLPLVATMITYVQIVSASSIVLSAYILKLFFRTDHQNIPQWMEKLLAKKRSSKVVDHNLDDKEAANTWQDVSRACDRAGLIAMSLILTLPSLVMVLLLVT